MLTPTRIIGLLSIVAFAGSGATMPLVPTKPQVSTVKKVVTIPFEKDVLALEAADRKSPPMSGGVLFYGSSSVRFWKTLKQDFPGLNVVNHGFGGSTAPDALRYFDRLVVPCQPSTIVFYEGDNDLCKHRTPEQFLADCQNFAQLAQDKLPATSIVFVSVKPSPVRVDLLAAQRQSNALLESWIHQSNDPRLSFVNVFEPMLDEDGLPRPELFGSDHLHMNRDGYKLWVKVIGALPALESKARLQTTMK